MRKTFMAFAISILFTTNSFAKNEPAKNKDYMSTEHMMPMTSNTEKGVRVINVVTESINGKTRYSPAVFIVKSGEKVKFKIFNATDKPHGFSIDAYKIKGNLVPNDNTIEFTANKAGLFEVYCQYHPAHLTAQLFVMN